MSSTPTPAVSDSLILLAAHPGALWSGLIDRSHPGLLSFFPDGSPRQSSPADSVLIDAIITASAALAARIGLDPPTDFDHRSPNGGLLIHSPDSSHCLVLCHGPNAPIPLLRLALRDCALHLPPPNPPQIHSWQPTTPIWSDPPLEPIFITSDQSKVYNPFTSA